MNNEVDSPDYAALVDLSIAARQKGKKPEFSLKNYLFVPNRNKTVHFWLIIHYFDTKWT